MLLELNPEIIIIIIIIIIVIIKIFYKNSMRQNPETKLHYLGYSLLPIKYIL